MSENAPVNTGAAGGPDGSSASSAIRRMQPELHGGVSHHHHGWPTGKTRGEPGAVRVARRVGGRDRDPGVGARCRPPVGEGGSVLEVAAGPGYFCTELAKLGNFKIIGLDISNDLVEIARRNAREAGIEIDFQRGNASGMQFPDQAFDLVFCSWA